MCQSVEIPKRRVNMFVQLRITRKLDTFFQRLTVGVKIVCQLGQVNHVAVSRPQHKSQRLFNEGLR